MYNPLQQLQQPVFQNIIIMITTVVVVEAFLSPHWAKQKMKNRMEHFAK